MDIKNMYGETWVLTSFGAYGPVSASRETPEVYLFTKAEARRVLKSRSLRPLLQYSTMHPGALNPHIAGASAAWVFLSARIIRFGCQTWKGSDAKALRKWALSK